MQKLTDGGKTRILLVDNYDSFTFNLENLLLSQENVSLVVRRNDEDFLSEIRDCKYDGAVIGPGPGSPEEEAYFGNNRSLILDYGTGGFPILGVCLGFQGIYHCFGGALKLGEHPVHGKVSRLSIEKPGCILRNVPDKSPVMRYHSIVANSSNAVPPCLEITSYACEFDRDVADKSAPMSLEHKEHPVYGVQFHPESFATIAGGIMIRNFLDKCQDVRARSR